MIQSACQINTFFTDSIPDPFLSGLGRAAEQVQKGVIPNKSRAEEIATQQFNAAKKEQSVSENSKSSFLICAICVKWPKLCVHYFEFPTWKSNLEWNLNKQATKF